MFFSLQDFYFFSYLVFIYKETLDGQGKAPPDGRAQPTLLPSRRASGALDLFLCFLDHLGRHAMPQEAFQEALVEALTGFSLRLGVELL